MQTMKDTKIKWLGEIPDSWQLKKIKYVLQERIEKNNPVRTTYILSLTAKQGVIPYDEKEGGGNKPKEDVSAYRLAYPGDIVMNSMNILSGSVGLSQNQDFFSMLLSNDEMKRQVLGIFSGEIYKSLRESL